MKTQNQELIESAVHQAETIIECLNDFYEHDSRIHTIADGDKVSTYKLNSKADLINLYIDYCYDEDLWNSVNRFLSYIISNEILADLFTDYVYNDVVNELNSEV